MEKTYELTPATSEEIGWIAELEAAVYSAEDAIPRDVLEKWYRKNPGGFYILRRNDGEKVGHIDLLPIRTGALRALCEGKIIEREIRDEDLFSPEEREGIRDLWLESVILSETGPGRTEARASLLTNLIHIVRNLCDPGQIESVYAIAATDKGARFLKRLGFVVASAGEGRKDRHDLQVIRFDDLLERISSVW